LLFEAKSTSSRDMSRLVIFDAKGFDKQSFLQVSQGSELELVFLQEALSAETAHLARGTVCVCAFVNDDLSRQTLTLLAQYGVRLVALRCAGFNQVDLEAAAELDIRVTRVPAYSPHAVAEHAVALMLCLNRKICKAGNRVRELNFALEGLVGFDMNGKTIGIVGTGRIGQVLARLMLGFGCRVLAFDPQPNPALQAFGVTYVPLESLYAQADIISLHVPLMDETRYMISDQAFRQMKAGVMLINTSRGGLIDSRALIEALKQGQVGAAGLDVYEEEEKIFFKDRSGEILHDDLLARLMTFPNVLITAHQAFLTKDALQAIAASTLSSVQAFMEGRPLETEIRSPVLGRS
jgi:D-lactate dehydrogenase